MDKNTDSFNNFKAGIVLEKEKEEITKKVKLKQKAAVSMLVSWNPPSQSATMDTDIPLTNPSHAVDSC